MIEIREANPLQWPTGWPRTDPHRRQYARFQTTFHASATNLFNEIRLLGAKYPIITSNLMLRNDGIPYSNQKRPEEPGIAVYFTLDGVEQCIPCDKWTHPEDNLRAIEKTVLALRGIERWGAKEMVKAAFKGFTAIGYDPDGNDKIIPPVQFFADCHDLESLRIRYRELVKQLHPDVGGNQDDFNEMQKQYNALKATLS